MQNKSSTLFVHVRESAICSLECARRPSQHCHRVGINNFYLCLGQILFMCSDYRETESLYAAAAKPFTCADCGQNLLSLAHCSGVCRRWAIFLYVPHVCNARPAIKIHRPCTFTTSLQMPAVAKFIARSGIRCKKKKQR